MIEQFKVECQAIANAQVSTFGEHGCLPDLGVEITALFSEVRLHPIVALTQPGMPGRDRGKQAQDLIAPGCQR